MTTTKSGRKFSAVVGTQIKRYTDEDCERMYPADWFKPLELRYRAGMVASAKHDLIGKNFIFETLACGCLGDCLGIAGERSVRLPAKRRMCDTHGWDEDDE